MTKPHTKIVFIDTEQFDTNKLSFANPSFTRLGDLVRSQLAKVLLTEVVDREVRRHIRKSFKDAKRKLGQDFGGLFQNLGKGPTPPPLTEQYWANAEIEVNDQFDACCERMKAEILPLNPELVKVVFDWYFAASTLRSIRQNGNQSFQTRFLSRVSTSGQTSEVSPST